MKPEEHLDFVRRWLRFAREDFQSAQRLYEIAPPRQTCFFAQQSAEKALKSVLIYLQIETPRTHNLLLLQGFIPEEWGLSSLDLAELNEYAVESRYPGAWEEPAKEDARRALKMTEAVFHAVIKSFNGKNVL
ncbi:MAG TPA: HEPN domain-containing protein [Chroococcales cyanobacterium]|jgi:HEPN domain-containing protein